MRTKVPKVHSNVTLPVRRKHDTSGLKSRCDPLSAVTTQNPILVIINFKRSYAAGGLEIGSRSQVLLPSG